MVWITCGLLWCFYQLFGLSFWRHPFTAEHPLLRHWCRDTFLQTWWRNKLILILNRWINRCRAAQIIWFYMNLMRSLYWDLWLGILSEFEHSSSLSKWPFFWDLDVHLCMRYEGFARHLETVLIKVMWASARHSFD